MIGLLKPVIEQCARDRLLCIIFDVCDSEIDAVDTRMACSSEAQLLVSPGPRGTRTHVGTLTRMHACTNSHTQTHAHPSLYAHARCGGAGPCGGGRDQPHRPQPSPSRCSKAAAPASAVAGRLPPRASSPVRLCLAVCHRRMALAERRHCGCGFVDQSRILPGSCSCTSDRKLRVPTWA